jgi:hypothetical protein
MSEPAGATALLSDRRTIDHAVALRAPSNGSRTDIVKRPTLQLVCRPLRAWFRSQHLEAIECYCSAPGRSDSCRRNKTTIPQEARRLDPVITRSVARIVALSKPRFYATSITSQSAMPPTRKQARRPPGDSTRPEFAAVPRDESQMCSGGTHYDHEVL